MAGYDVLLDAAAFAGQTYRDTEPDRADLPGRLRC